MGRNLTHRLLGRLAAFAAAVTVVLAATAVPAAAATWTDVWIQTTQGTARCVAAPNASDGAHMSAATCVDDAKQLWTLTLSGGYYTIVDVGTGLCLANGGTLSGAPVEQHPCIGATWEQWTLTGSGNTFSFRNRGANLCMVPQNGLVGSPVVLVTCATGQTWQLLL